MKSLIPWKKPAVPPAFTLWDDDWFDRLWERSLWSMPVSFGKLCGSRLPSIELSENDKEVIVKAEVPGLSEKDLELTWHNGILRIRGEKKEEREKKKKGYTYSECSYGYFVRDIPVGNNVNWKDARAKYRHGILTVHLPKGERVHKPVSIKIN